MYRKKDDALNRFILFWPMQSVLSPRTLPEGGRNTATVASPSKDPVSGTVYPLSCVLQTFHRLYSENTENLSLRHHITASAHLRHHFLVAL